MSEGEKSKGDALGAARPAVRAYAILAAAALAVIALVLVQDNYGLWGMVPAGLGVAGVLTAWGSAPALVLLNVLLLLMFRNFLLGWTLNTAPPTDPAGDLAICASMLVYLVAATRHLTLVRQAVPPDPRREHRPRNVRLRGRWFSGAAEPTRTAEALARGEFPGVFVAATGATVVAIVFWSRVSTAVPPEFIGPTLWRVGLAAAACLFVAFVVWQTNGWLALNFASADEARAYLADQLWAMTRGDLRRANRRIVRARAKAIRRAEK